MRSTPASPQPSGRADGGRAPRARRLEAPRGLAGEQRAQRRRATTTSASGRRSSARGDALMRLPALADRRCVQAASRAPGPTTKSSPAATTAPSSTGRSRVEYASRMSVPRPLRSNMRSSTTAPPSSAPSWRRDHRDDGPRHRRQRVDDPDAERAARPSRSPRGGTGRARCPPSAARAMRPDVGRERESREARSRRAGPRPPRRDRPARARCAAARRAPR